MSQDFVTVVEVEDAPFVTVVEVEEPRTDSAAEDMPWGSDSTTDDRPGRSDSTTEDRPWRTDSASEDRPWRSDSTTEDRAWRSDSAAEDRPPLTGRPVEEEVELFRLPGERLGFGLKFEGASTVLGLTVESTAEGSPSARARASWGPLGPGDSILSVDGRNVSDMTRQEVVRRLTESGLVVRLRVRRGPPPVPPRRQQRRRMPGPPPPPRPFPRTPPRLVDFLPKDTDRPADPTVDRNTSGTMNSLPDHCHKIEINGEGPGFTYQDTSLHPKVDSMNLDDAFKEKIIPLKNLNPKLVSLFEHSHPLDTNVKASHVDEINPKLWTNDDKCRRSVKDKIALFSNEIENSFQNKTKKQDNNFEVFKLSGHPDRKLQKRFHKSLSSLDTYQGLNNFHESSKVNTAKKTNMINGNSNQNSTGIDSESIKSDKPSLNSSDPAISTNITPEKFTAPVTLTQSQENISSEKKEKRFVCPVISDKISTKFNFPKLKSLDDFQRMSLNNLREQRKNSLYKDSNLTTIQGLVSPTNLPQISTSHELFDLSNIKNSDAIQKVSNPVNNELPNNNSVIISPISSPTGLSNYPDFYQISNQKSEQQYASLNNISSNNVEWKGKLNQGLPKYSPAFKRKVLSVFEHENIDGMKPDSNMKKDGDNDMFSQNNSKLTQGVKETEPIDKKLNPENLLVLQKEFNSKVKPEPETNTDEINSETSAAKENGLSVQASETEQNGKQLISAKEENDCKMEINTINCYSKMSGQHSKSSSMSSGTIESHLSESFCNGDSESTKESHEIKTDSLLSQDMSDSGNHSIPSNYCNSKSVSCDNESMSSMVFSEIPNLDDTSINSSVEEGQLIDLNCENNNILDSNNEYSEQINLNIELPQGIIVNTEVLITEGNVKTVETHSIDSASQPTENLIMIGDVLDHSGNKNINLNDIQGNKIDSLNPSNSGEIKDGKSDLSSQFNDKESTDEGAQFKPINLNRIQQKHSEVKPIEQKNGNIIPFPVRDSNEEGLCTSLSSPISDLQRENHFASITSLASSTSLISQQELFQLIEESNDNITEDSNDSSEISVIVLHRDTAEGSIGITLAGGVDYESKEITVHKVLSGSPADRDGRIKKGHRILSINGKSMKGLTHIESLAVLKAPRHEVVLVVAKSNNEVIEENNNISINNNRHSNHHHHVSYTPPTAQPQSVNIKWGPIMNINLTKEGAGLGFSLKGGKDSPCGDQPLTVQKIFTGGCAEKSGQIMAGDELLSINDFDLSGMTRVEAWTLMKRLPDGVISLKIRHPAI